VKIGIFAPMTGRQSGGPETYELQLVHALSDARREHSITVYCANENAAASFRAISSKLRVFILRPDIRWISFALSLPLELLRRTPDVMHATYVAPPYVPGKFVFTLHDLSPFSNPEFYPPAIRFRLQKGFASSIRRAAAVLCVSEFTRRHLVDQFPFAAEKARVVPHGVDPAFHRMKDREEVRRRLQTYGLREPYVLCLGKLQARKNTLRVLEAFHVLKKETGLPHKLAMVGRKMWTSSEVYPLIERLGLTSQVVLTGHVVDSDLALLYNGADALAFPSLFEGFGLPVLEAMACGCPVVTSNTTSLPEVAGSAALLVDPYRAEAIAEGLACVLTDAAVHQDLAAKGLERARQFTWEKTAQQVLEAYGEVAGYGTSGRNS
jgi:glycosyltransferase involved in cell wall biosynthesis